MKRTALKYISTDRFVLCYAPIAGLPSHRKISHDISGQIQVRSVCATQTRSILSPLFQYIQILTQYSQRVHMNTTMSCSKQVQERKKRRLANWSRQLDNAQCHSSIVEQEALAMVVVYQGLVPLPVWVQT